MNIDIPPITYKLPSKIGKKASTLFCQQVLNCWNQYLSVAPLIKSEVSDEYLCLNKYIKLNSKYISTNHRIHQNIFKIRIRDVMESDIFSTKHNCYKETLPRFIKNLESKQIYCQEEKRKKKHPHITISRKHSIALCVYITIPSNI